MKAQKIEQAELPLYEILIDENDETGMKLISLVDMPAIGVKGMMFSEVQAQDYFFKTEDDKQIIVGPALIPDIKIKRKDDAGNDYYVMFSQATIEKMVQKFNKYGSNRRINIDHSKEMVDGFIMEDWIVEDPTHDKSKLYGFEVPVGTYMIKVKIEDKNFWEKEIKGEGKFGFSIEGLLDQKLISLSEVEESTIDDLDIIDLCYIFDVFSEDIKCTCNHQEFATAREGVVHPNCRCDMDLDGFKKSTGYIGRDGKEYPCVLCDQAQKNWNRSGRFRDVFGNSYVKSDVFPYYIKKSF